MNDTGTLAAGGQVLDIGRYARAARRQWLLVLAFAIGGGVLGWWQFDTSEQRYEATAVVEVGPGLHDLTSDADSGVETTNIETQKQIAMSVRVVAKAIEDIPGALTVGQFQRWSELTSPQDSSAMLLTFQGTSPAQARDGALAWANAYLQDRTTELTNALDKSREKLLKRESAIQGVLGDARVTLDEAVAGTAREQTARAHVRALSTRAANMRTQLDDLDSMLVSPGSVLGEPQTPTAAVGLPGGVYLGAGMFAGLLLGLALALLIERITDRIRDGRDLQRVTDAPVWATTPRSSTDDKAVDLAYDAVATRLLLAIRHSNLRSVLITAAEADAMATAERVASRLRRLGQEVRVTTDVEDLLHQPEPDRILVVGAAPVLADPRIGVLSAEADATLMVLRTKRTRAKWLSAAIAMLQSCDGSVSGIVMDRCGVGVRPTGETSRLDAALPSATPSANAETAPEVRTTPMDESERQLASKGGKSSK